MAVKESTTAREVDGGPPVMGLRGGLADSQTHTWIPAALAGIDELNQRIVSMLFAPSPGLHTRWPKLAKDWLNVVKAVATQFAI